MAGEGRRQYAPRTPLESGGLERGQATVEMVLTLPVVVLFTLTVIQVGLVGKDLLIVQHAAREGARAAAVEPTQAAALSGVIAGSGLAGERIVVDLSGGQSEGDRVTVTVSYRSPTNVPLVGALVPDVDLRSSVTMRVE